MLNPTTSKLSVGALRGRSESANIDLAPDAVLKADSFAATHGVLTVKNKELEN